MKNTKTPYPVSTGRKIYRVAIVTTLAYCSIGIALYHLQKKLLFHPESLPHDYAFRFDVPFREINIAMNNTDTLNMVCFLPADSVPKGVVIYFHGNKGNIIRFAKYANNFTKHGYEVWMPDYPSYGKTTGPLTEENMYAQAKEVYKLAHSRFGTDSIIVYGKSLGSGVASYIASREKCRSLILETPYSSIPDLVRRYAFIYPVSRMLHFKFPVIDYLPDVKAPVTIFHGTSDNVIPYSCSSKLKKVLKPGDEFITIEKGTHHNLNEFSLFHQKIDSVLNY
jgi:pimeloyl-ACP methyl ester carboxylesterase